MGNGFLFWPVKWPIYWAMDMAIVFKKKIEMIDKNNFYNNLAGCLKFFLLAPFIIGLIWNWDGLRILFSFKSYKSGILIVSDFHGDRGIDGAGDLVLYADGKIDSVQTSVMVEKRSDSIPIWYRSDGKLTILKYPNESEFPFWRIFWKLIFYFSLFNGPFIGLWTWQLYLKRKLKRSEK